MNSAWTEEEDQLILSLQKEWGNRWSSIASVGVDNWIEDRIYLVVQRMLSKFVGRLYVNMG